MYFDLINNTSMQNNSGRGNMLVRISQNISFNFGN